jgi:hypothetical protein
MEAMMKGFGLRLRNLLGRFEEDVKPRPGGGVRQAYVETIKKKGGKKK